MKTETEVKNSTHNLLQSISHINPLPPLSNHKDVIKYLITNAILTYVKFFKLLIRIFENTNFNLYNHVFEYEEFERRRLPRQVFRRTKERVARGKEPKIDTRKSICCTRHTCKFALAKIAEISTIYRSLLQELIKFIFLHPKPTRFPGPDPEYSGGTR